MLTKKKSIILCFVIGALLCTLISCGSSDSMSAGDAMTVASSEGPPGREAEIQDIRKTSLEENTREIVKAAIKSTESDSRQDQEVSPEAVAARIAGASVVSGAADYGTTVQNEQAVQTDDVQAEETEMAAAETEMPEAVAPELENKVVTTVDTYQNIRLEPSEDSEIVGRLYEGSAGEVLETADGWTKISSGGVEGWVHNEYVVSGEDAQTFAEESLRQVATVKEEGVRVRAGASLDAPWVGMVDLNETYRIVPEEIPEEEPVEPETAPEEESTETPGQAEASPETENSEVIPETTQAAESETPMVLEAPVGAEPLVVPETGNTEETVPASQPAEPEMASTEVQPEESQPVSEAELKWIKIIYDGDKEGYVCADYVTTSFVLGKAKSIEEIRAEEEAAARAAAEKAAAEKAARAKAAAKAAASEDVSAGSGWVSLGEFKITAYCGGACCNGQWAGTTSSGASPTEGRTIAVAPGLIPYGSRVKVAGMDSVFVAEDTGGFANSNPRQIDIYYADHGRATSKGVSYREIWVQR
ncbi:MAG: SH3 domain-containing protein [Lachnospiraceae bacterium]|nr:SH3 domain-containing protein [Lachnospiraceae bacterium]